MRVHTANELRYQADILDADGQTVLTPGVRCGVEYITGRRNDQPQLAAATTSHMILFRAGDADLLTDSGYVRIEGVLYIVEARVFADLPRPGVWVEVFCHVERSGN